jgi:hypothetical protein
MSETDERPEDTRASHIGLRRWVDPVVVVIAADEVEAIGPFGASDSGLYS